MKYEIFFGVVKIPFHITPNPEGDLKKETITKFQSNLEITKKEIFEELKANEMTERVRIDAVKKTLELWLFETFYNFPVSWP